jgi:Ser-tRNA(Ala) deacylase AlaX
VRIKGEVVYHYGQISAGAGIPVGTSVQLKVDAQKRRTCNKERYCNFVADLQVLGVHARLHSAGHLVDVAVRSILPDLKPGRGCHFPGGSYVEYEGTVPEQTKPSLKASLETELGKLVSERIKTSVCDASVDDVPSLCGGWMPDYLTDKSKLYRIVTVGGLGCPCGGTHVDSTDELAGLTVTGVKFPKGKMKVSYNIK